MRQIRRSWKVIVAASSGMLLMANACDQHHRTPKKHSNRLSPITEADRAEAQRGAAAWKAAGASDSPANIPPGKPPNYRKYPVSVRRLIRLADIEGGHCRGDFGDDAKTLRACNREYYLLVALEKKGWCWGGGEYSYQEHWLKCVDDPDYRPGDYGSRPPYSQRDIAEVAHIKAKK